MKIKSSAAVSTLSMVSVLSVMSEAFSSQAATSMGTDSKDQSQAEEQNGSDNERDNENPRTKTNLKKSKVKSPMKQKPKPLFQSFKDGAIRDKIEIKIQTKNGKKFPGSITPLDIKYNVYINTLKCSGHERFDSVRVVFKGKLVATIKRINPINIDKLSDTLLMFDFTRTNFFRGRITKKVIGC